jgi:hypothetical protein
MRTTEKRMKADNWKRTTACVQLNAENRKQTTKADSRIRAYLISSLFRLTNSASSAGFFMNVTYVQWNALIQIRAFIFDPSNRLVWCSGVGGGGSRTKPINGTGVWTRLGRSSYSQIGSPVAATWMKLLGMIRVRWF